MLPCCGEPSRNPSGCSLTLGHKRVLWTLPSPLNPFPFRWTSEHWMGALLAESTTVRFLSTCECQATSESMQFLLLEFPHVPMVVGFSWLQRPNPVIDWAPGSIRGWSPFCHAHCLKSEPPTLRSSPCWLGKNLGSLLHSHRVLGLTGVFFFAASSPPIPPPGASNTLPCSATGLSPFECSSRYQPPLLP
jgi:hypothetical protein